VNSVDPPAQISRTSIWAAAARALGAREPDARVRNPDWLAERLLGPDELALLGDHPLVDALAQPYEVACQNMEALGAARILIPRTRFIDSRLEEAVDQGDSQIVILGAGFDSRAYRFSERLQHLRIFEVDQEATQQRKIRRVREAIGQPPANLVYVPIDFRKDTLGDALTRAGYQPDRKTIFIWEGVTMYLPGQAVRDTLHWIASNAAAESNVVFDYTYEAAIRMSQNIDINQLPERIKQAFMRLRSLTATEPWIFGLPDEGEREFLAGLGLELRTIMGMNSAEAVEKYLTRADGSIFGLMPATGRQGYLILEAVVPSLPS
jgi:methyltransferase (TIGR00027 family)